MAQFLDEKGLQALWEKIKGTYLKTADLATVNGQKLSNGGNVTIDLTLFKIVDSLPTTDIDETKIYLVANSQTSGSNVYTEYIYANGKWEILGEYKSDIDLTPYVKTTTMNTALATKVDTVNTDGSGNVVSGASIKGTVLTLNRGITVGDGTITINQAGTKKGSFTLNQTGNVTIDLTDNNTTYSAATTGAAGLMSASDKSKLDGIATNANNYVHPTSAAGAKASGLYKITTDANGHVTAATAVAKADITALGIPAQDTTYGVATTSADGLMASADKSKLDGIAANATADEAIPVATVESICV